MSDADNIRAVQGLWELFQARRWDDAGELLHDDFVAKWPHSGERIRGRENFIAVNRNYPEGWAIQVLRIVASGEDVVSEVSVLHGGSTFYAASFFEMRDGKILRATEYWVEGDSEDPPQWRASWVER